MNGTLNLKHYVGGGATTKEMINQLTKKRAALDEQESKVHPSQQPNWKELHRIPGIGQIGRANRGPVALSRTWVAALLSCATLQQRT